MPEYAYTALTPSGAAKQNRIEAVPEDQARARFEHAENGSCSSVKLSTPSPRGATQAEKRQWEETIR